jgi:hypothetical protein
VAAGLWRAAILGHAVYLASTVDLPVDADSLPLHLLALEPRERERQVGAFVVATPERVDAYGGLFAVLHQSVWQEVEAMARRGRRALTFDLRPAIETLGLAEVIRQIGEAEVIRQIGAKELLEELDVEAIVANLPAAKRRELKQRLAEAEAKP